MICVSREAGPPRRRLVAWIGSTGRSHVRALALRALKIHGKFGLQTEGIFCASRTCLSKRDVFLGPCFYEGTKVRGVQKAQKKKDVTASQVCVCVGAC